MTKNTQFSVGFVYSPSIYSWFIKAFTGGEVTHCFIRFNNLCVHAVGKKTQVKTYQDTLNEVSLCYEFELPQLTLTASVDVIEKIKKEYLNKPYDWLSIFGFLWAILINRLSFNKIKLHNPFAADDNINGYFCSEQCLDFLQNTFPDNKINTLFREYDQNVISPSALKSLLESKGFVATVSKNTYIK